MSEPIEPQADQKSEKPKKSRLLHNRITYSVAVGVLLSLASFVILGFNLSAGGGIRTNDYINSYFDTCVGNGFVDNTPRIRTEERGFPLAFHEKNLVPVCETTGVELKRVSASYIDYGAFLANILFWSCVSFIIIRKFTRPKRT